ncbi:DJ-1/PfpI family protein [Roseivivax sp. CAU 1753]
MTTPKIAILVSPGFADWEYALIAGTGGPFYGLEVDFYATEPGLVASQGGLMAQVSRGIDDLADAQPDVVVVVGGMIWETADAPDIAAPLRALHDRGAVIAGICGGTLALARAGLLDATPHTSNDLGFLATHARGYDVAARYRHSAAAVVSDRIITAPGTAPVSFTAAVFESAGLAPEAVSAFRAMMAAEHA